MEMGSVQLRIAVCVRMDILAYIPAKNHEQERNAKQCLVPKCAMARGRSRASFLVHVLINGPWDDVRR